MVNGLDIFKKYFSDFSNSYVVIGGTACDLILSDAGLKARATKDIDIILAVEALNREFVLQFWRFVKDGQYERNERSPNERKYYRFLKPANNTFPLQIELFSRAPDFLTETEAVHLTPIPVDEDLSSLSAILMNDDYYCYTIMHSTQQSAVRRANTEALICLKANAFLNLRERKANGESIDERNIRKHKNDVFRWPAT